MSRKNRNDYDLTLDEALQLMEGAEEVELVAPPWGEQFKQHESSKNPSVKVTRYVGRVSERVPA